MLGEALGDLAGRSTAGNSFILDKVAEGITSLARAGETAMGSIRRLTESLEQFLLAPLKNMAALGNEIAPLVAAFNPGAAIQFGLALHDVNAVMGLQLQPVLVAVTEYTRKFGDALLGMAPVFEPLISKISGFITAMGDQLGPLMEAAAPMIQLLSDALGELLRMLAEGVGFVTGAVTELLEIINELFGLTSRFKPDEQSKGLGTRQTRVQSVAEFADTSFASAARNIYNREGGEKKPSELLAGIREEIKAGKEFVKTIKEDVTKIRAWFDRNISGPLGKAEHAADVAGEIANELFRKFGMKRPW